MADAGELRQARTNWGRFFLTLIVGGVPTAICFILGWWWAGTAFLLLTLLAACFSLSTVAYPTAFSLYAMFAIGWLSGAWLDVALHRAGADAWWRTVVPVAGGITIGIVVTIFFWFVTFAVSTKWLLGLDESYDEIGWWKAFVFVFTRFFGFARPFVRVENGGMTVGSKKGLFHRFIDPSLLEKLGGPGALVVGEGNVVVLERGGRLSRILGQGTHFLRHNERIKEPVDTKGIHDLRGGGGPAITVEKVLTKDGVPLDIEIGGGCRLELKSDTDKRPSSRFAGAEASSPVIGTDSQYAIYEATIRKAVYGTGPGGWKTAFPGGAVGALRDVVATYTLDQIFGTPGAEPCLDSDERVVKQIENKVKAAIGQRPTAQGIVFGGIGIKDIKVPDNVRAVMTQRMMAPMRREARLQEAEASRQALVVESQGRAESIGRIEEARIAASDKWRDVIESLRNVLPKIENEQVAFEFVAVVRDLLGRIGQDDRETQRQLRSLQRLLADEERYVATSLGATAGYVHPSRLIQGQAVPTDDQIQKQSED